MNYYNDNNAGAAAWLRELIVHGEIPYGEIDTHSIHEIQYVPDFHQYHFFAGIGGWPLALRMAGWPEDWPVWTGSCPCQPFSQAGRRKGAADARHLWPEWFRLIRQFEPAIIFGEQVASADGRLWVDGVRSDMEGMGHAFGVADLCAAGVGSPHIRQRLYWVSISPQFGRNSWGRDAGQQKEAWERRGGPTNGREIVFNAVRPGRIEQRGTISVPPPLAGAERSSHAYWQDAYLAEYSGAHRRLKPGISPLVDGFPGRVGLLRGYGNAIVPQVAAEFVSSVMDFLSKERV